MTDNRTTEKLMREFVAVACECEVRDYLISEYAERIEQAIAAALGNTRAERTCKSTTGDSAWCFVCSECGKSFPRNKLYLAHNHGEINYCPNCGAKVVG